MPEHLASSQKVKAGLTLMTLVLDYGNYGVFLSMAKAGLISSARRAWGLMGRMPGSATPEPRPGEP